MRNKYAGNGLFNLIALVRHYSSLLQVRECRVPPKRAAGDSVTSVGATPSLRSKGHYDKLHAIFRIFDFWTGLRRLRPDVVPMS